MSSLLLSCSDITIELEFEDSWKVFVNQALVVGLQGLNVRDFSTLRVQIENATKIKRKCLK